jgi:hypothetical protein
MKDSPNENPERGRDWLMILCLVIGLGALATLGIRWYRQWDAAFGADMQKAVSVAMAPIFAPSKQVSNFISQHHRPPKDVEELAAFAKNDPDFDPSKYSELRLEFPSNGTVVVIFRMAPPHPGVTNAITWQQGAFTNAITCQVYGN